ncbi:hypothetical protein J1N35_014258 [Gossypium stocksii]|uniref:HTH CENPB-type domain-containing protein n=1 Tax=Gossypium stocksii TaxID=47602 RepID=A0A9D3VTZ2_9ROSI|nr:hypothetical protein J1N35_014258 [Gossypium stocksii]
MTREMIQTKVKEFLQKMYGDANSECNFSIGWLEWFKARHGIKSYKRFGESGSVIMENIEDTLPQIRAKLENFDWKDIYNMDETYLFYRLQEDHSLATKNAMDFEHILNYPSENEYLMESPMDEEIIQGVMDVSIDDEQDLDESSVLPHVSPKEAFLAVDTMKNYLIKHEKIISDLVYAILKVKDEIVFDSHAKK